MGNSPASGGGASSSSGGQAHHPVEDEVHRFKLHKEVERQLLQSTHFSREELQQWYTEFRHLYPHQKITKEDYVDATSKRLPIHDALFWGHIFDLFDTSHDEEISFVEWIQVLSFLTRGSVSEKLEFLFGVFDVNSDDFIHKEELYYIVSLLHNVNPSDVQSPQDFVDHIFREWDVDGDDSISRAEFIAGVTHFKHLNKSIIRLNQLIGESLTQKFSP